MSNSTKEYQDKISSMSWLQYQSHNTLIDNKERYNQRFREGWVRGVKKVDKLMREQGRGIYDRSIRTCPHCTLQFKGMGYHNHLLKCLVKDVGLSSFVEEINNPTMHRRQWADELGVHVGTLSLMIKRLRTNNLT